MSCQPVEVDASTAADFKGLFQTVVVRRFKNTVGIRYEMVPTEDVLQFNSYAVLYYIEDNKYIIDFRRTGTSYSRTNEKFKVSVYRDAIALVVRVILIGKFWWVTTTYPPNTEFTFSRFL